MPLTASLAVLDTRPDLGLELFQESLLRRDRFTQIRQRPLASGHLFGALPPYFRGLLQIAEMRLQLPLVTLGPVLQQAIFHLSVGVAHMTANFLAHLRHALRERLHHLSRFGDLRLPAEYREPHL